MLLGAEGVCEDCCLVHEHVCVDADTNSGSSLGEARHNKLSTEMQPPPAPAMAVV